MWQSEAGGTMIFPNGPLQLTIWTPSYFHILKLKKMGWFPKKFVFGPISNVSFTAKKLASAFLTSIQSAHLKSVSSSHVNTFPTFCIALKLWNCDPFEIPFILPSQDLLHLSRFFCLLTSSLIFNFSGIFPPLHSPITIIFWNQSGKIQFENDNNSLSTFQNSPITIINYFVFCIFDNPWQVYFNICNFSKQKTFPAQLFHQNVNFWCIQFGICVRYNI